MTKFKVGDIVRCVDPGTLASPPSSIMKVGDKIVRVKPTQPGSLLKVGGIYTISKYNNGTISLEEDTRPSLIDRSMHWRYASCYFAPYVPPVDDGDPFYDETPEIAEIRATFIAKRGEVKNA